MSICVILVPIHTHIQEIYIYNVFILKLSFLGIGASSSVDRSDIVALARGMMDPLTLYNGFCLIKFYMFG